MAYVVAVGGEQLAEFKVCDGRAGEERYNQCMAEIDQALHNHVRRLLAQSHRP